MAIPLADGPGSANGFDAEPPSAESAALRITSGRPGWFFI